MSAIDVLTLISKDESAPGAGDEVTRAFHPAGTVNQDVAEWFDKSSGIPVAYPRVRTEVRRGNSRTDSVLRVKLDFPVLAATSPSTASGIEPNATRAYNVVGDARFVLPRQSSVEARTEFATLFKSLIRDQLVQAGIISEDFPW